MVSPYELLGGEAGVRALCEAFYDIMNTLPEAQPIRRMHGDDLEPITEKLFEYLSGWLGGPMLYQKRHGSICMTGPHRPYAIGPRERDQWLQCMDLALERINASAEVKAMLKPPLSRIADAVRNRDHSEADATNTATSCASII
jgi:hemoglobin